MRKLLIVSLIVFSTSCIDAAERHDEGGLTAEQIEKIARSNPHLSVFHMLGIKQRVSDARPEQRSALIEQFMTPADQNNELED